MRSSSLSALCGLVLLVVSNAFANEINTAAGAIENKNKEKLPLERMLEEMELNPKDFEWGNKISRTLRDDYAGQEEEEDDLGEENDEEEEDEDSLRQGGRDLQATNGTCKFKLRKIAQYVLNYKYNYEIYRDNRRPRWNSGNGPSRYKLNKMGPALQPQCTSRKSYVLTFFVPSIPKGYKYYTGGCLAFQDAAQTHEAHVPTIAAFDCHGNQIACAGGDWLYNTNADSKRGLLLVLVPPNMRRPTAYKFFFRKNPQNTLWCDWYPF